MNNQVPYLTWKGDTERLQVNPERATRDGRTLGLAVYVSTTVEFRDLKVKALSGEIKPYVFGE